MCGLFTFTNICPVVMKFFRSISGFTMGEDGFAWGAPLHRSGLLKFVPDRERFYSIIWSAHRGFSEFLLPGHS